MRRRVRHVTQEKEKKRLEDELAARARRRMEIEEVDDSSSDDDSRKSDDDDDDAEEVARARALINNIVQSQSSSKGGSSSSGGGGRANVNKRTEQPKEGKVPSPPVAKSKSDPSTNEITSKDGASAQAQKSSQSASRLQAGKVAAGLGVSVDKTAAKPSNKIRPTAEAVSAMHALVMFSGKAVVITIFIGYMYMYEQ